MADFNIDGSDAACVAFLHQRLPGTRGPANVLTDVNPYNFHPRNLPEGLFYLVASNVPKFNEHGYWELLGVEIRIVGSSCVGWLKNLDFYEGQAPNAIKTNWIMQVYRLDDHEQQDRMLLCRVRHLIPDRGLEQLLYEMIAAEEENHQNFEHASHGGQVVNGNEQGPAVGPDHAANVLPLDGDYIELNDLMGYESSLSSGGNSSRLTFFSDDFMGDDDLNSEGILSDQESQTGPTPPNVSRCRARPPPGSNQVVIKPPSSGGVRGEKEKDTKVIPASTPASEKRAHKPSLSAPPTGEQTPGNVEDVNKAEATPSTSTARGEEKKKTSKITKIGKIFGFCFFS